jgi:hypothetical protein
VITATCAFAQTAPRLLAWIDNACVWDLNRRGFDCLLQSPDAAIPPDEDAVSIDAATAVRLAGWCGCAVRFERCARHKRRFDGCKDAVRASTKPRTGEHGPERTHRHFDNARAPARRSRISATRPTDEV